MHKCMVENSIKREALNRLKELRNEFKAASDAAIKRKRVVENQERLEISWANECARTTRMARKGEAV